MNVFAVTVTYGNRFHLLLQVIDRALAEGVKKVIVVDNNSENESKEKLKAYEKKLGSNKIKVLYLDNNYGSAGGFKRGLEEAFNDDDCEYILTLDDDNLIKEGSLKKVEALTIYLKDIGCDYMLSLYRDISDGNRKAIKEGWIKQYLPNNFRGYTLKSIIKKLFFKTHDSDIIYPLVPVVITGYGGLFFNKNIIKKIGYPNESFIVYADDYEYTYRFNQNGGKIFLCSEAQIIDLDITYNQVDKKRSVHFQDTFSEFKLYYSMRNHTFFSKYFIKNKILFYMNMFTFISLLFLRNIFTTPLPIFIKRFKIIIKGIQDGLHGRLGKVL